MILFADMGYLTFDVLFTFITLILITEISTRERKQLIDELNPFFRIIKLNLGRALERTVNSAVNREILERQNKAVHELPETTPFPCDLTGKLRSDKVPTNAHEVRPGDIDLIGGMGDSLSAGTGISVASLIQELFLDQRGRSFSIGGEKTWRTYLTLPNILKVYNPNLFGYALKAAQSFEWKSQFNVAEIGAISGDIPYMVTELVKRIKQDPRVDLRNHWKMITLMIGDNDFCSEICYSREYYHVLKEHREDLVYVLRYLRDNLPRTIVNIVPAPRLDDFMKMKNIPLECYFVHNFACPCITGLAYKHKREIFKDIMVKWQQIDVEVSNMEEFDLDDFTVIPHLTTLNYTFPRTSEGELDFAYLAPDCFHFSEKAQARFANDLWNSLLERFGNKSMDGADVFSKFHCPTEENPYIFTRRNSN